MVSIVLHVIVISALVAMVLMALYVIKYCRNEKKMPFVALMAFMFVYLAGNLLEIMSASADGALVANKVMYAGMVYAPPLLMYFISHYCNVKFRLRILVVMLLIPMAFVVMVWTSEWHDLFYVSVWFDYDSPVGRLEKERGPFNTVGHIFSILYMAGTLVMIVRHYIKPAGGNPIPYLIVAGVTLPIVLNVMHIAGVHVYNINYVPLGAAVSTLMLGVALIKHDMFDIGTLGTEIAIASMGEAFILLDEKGGYISANASAKKLFPQMEYLKENQPIGALRGWPPELPKLDGAESNTTMQIFAERERTYNVNVSPIIVGNSEIVGYVVLMQDITEIAEANKKLQEIAFTDPLTGILNRRHFTQLVNTEMEKIKRKGATSHIVYFDLDHFKKINDTYGHSVGDKVLVTAVERVKSAIRPYDLFCRFGGEEFVVYLEGTDCSDSMPLAERIRKAIGDAPMKFDGISFTVTASLGIAPVTAECRGIDDAIKVADAALYKAKEGGRNRTVAGSPQGGFVPVGAGAR